MSRWTEVTVKAGLDTFSFNTGTRDFSEEMGMKLHDRKKIIGGDAVAFLNGDARFHRGVNDHYRKIVYLMTYPERAAYSDSLNEMLSGNDPRPMEEKYAEVERQSSLSIEIFYAG